MKEKTIIEKFLCLDDAVDLSTAAEIAAGQLDEWIVIAGSHKDHLALKGRELRNLLEKLLDDREPDFLPGWDQLRDLIRRWRDEETDEDEPSVITTDGVPTGVEPKPPTPEPEPRPDTPDPEVDLRLKTTKQRGPRWLGGADADRTATVQSPGPDLGPVGAAPASQTAQPEPASLTQHLLAQTPTQLRVGDEAELQVTLSGDALVVADGSTVSFQADEGEKLCLLVHDFGALQLTGSPRVVLTTQLPGEKVSHSFPYRAATAGQGALQVSLLDSSLDELATLQVEVIATGDPRPEPQAVSASTTPTTPGPPRNMIRVGARDGQTLVFDLSLPLIGLDWEQGETSLRSNESAARLLAQFEQVRGTRRPYEQFQQAVMTSLGHLLADVIPDTVKAALWESREGLDQLELRSTLSRWPWEVAALASPSGDLPGERPFLGERGMTRLRPNTHLPKQLRLNGRRLVSAPSYPMLRQMALKSGPQEAEDLANSFGFTPCQTDTNGIVEQLNGGDFSIFHFVGHSVLQTENAGLGLPQLVTDSSSLSGDPPQVRSGVSPLMVLRGALSDNDPLVFLNACTTGGLLDASDGAGAVRGFPDAFLGAGAGVVIGTHWEVEDAPARRFANRFYQSFIEDRSTLATAVTEARLATLADDGSWSPSPLAYVVYGQPSAVVADEAPDPS